MSLPNDYYELENKYGYAILKKGDEKEDRQGIVFLDTLSIEKTFQGKGYGGTLLENILDEAFDFGYKKVIVHARPLEDDNRQNDLIRFYKKHGFIKSKNYLSFIGIYMEYDL